MISMYDALVLLLEALVVYLFYQRFLKMCYLRWFYSRQGVAFMSPFPKPFVGDALELARRIAADPHQA